MEDISDDKDLLSSTNLSELSIDVNTFLPKTIRKLRLEAIFHPKFENESRSDHMIRQTMIQKVQDGLGYLEVTLKHSGSLVLWSGGQRYYSKNSVDNKFTYTAEILLQQHFERSWRNTGEGMDRYFECSQYLEENRLTLSFEVVSAVLGDHGDTPIKDFVMLTAVADKSEERFYTTNEVIRLAQKFRLPHNDSWMFASSKSAKSLFFLYEKSRETGMAHDTVQALNALAEAHVSSMYQHVDFQGNILEGFIIRYISYGDKDKASQVRTLMNELSTNANDILDSVPLDLPPSFQVQESNGKNILSKDIREMFHDGGGYAALADDNRFELALAQVLADSGLRKKITRLAGGSIDIPALTKHLLESSDKETRRIAEGLQQIAKIAIVKRDVSYSIIKEESLDTNQSRCLCVIHILHDETFKLYHAKMRPGSMYLFRGFCIELSDQEPEKASEMQVESNPTHVPDQGEFLMLKMKYLPYMVRTFICRNKLRVIKQVGRHQFERIAKQILDKWQISIPSQRKWMPFFQSWAMYAQLCWGLVSEDEQKSILHESLPTLREFNYLLHLDYFSKLYKEGKAPKPRETTFGGFVLILSPSRATSRELAAPMAKRLDAELVEIGRDSNDFMSVGSVCYGCLTDTTKAIKKVLFEVDDCSAIILYACSDNDIEREILDEKDAKRHKGLRFFWKKQDHARFIELSKSEFLDSQPSPSEEFEESLKTIQLLVPKDEDESEKIPGAIVFVPGVPGCGKSTILQSMETRIRKELTKATDDTTIKKREVHVRVGDEVGKNFWSLSQKMRRMDSSCVFIADKNVPPASWSVVGTQSRDTMGVPIAVLPDSHALQTTNITGIEYPDKSKSSDLSHFYPFTLTYLAICMARVLDRKKASHKGKLDRGTKTACIIVIRFYSLYRSMSAEEFVQTIDSRLHNDGALKCLPPIIVPFFKKSTETDLPQDLHEVLVEALQLQYGYDTTKRKIKQNDQHILDLEKRLRSSIERHRKMLLAMTVSKEESVESFVSQIMEKINTLNEESIQCVGQEMKLVSIDVEKQKIHEILMDHSDGDISEFLAIALSDQSTDFNMEDGCYPGRSFVGRPHVTMYHHQEGTQEEMKELFGPIEGCKVELKVKSLLWDESIAAFSVTTADVSLDGKPIPRSKNAFSHITVWFAEGGSAVMSNELPERVKENKAKCIHFAEPITLLGTVAFWNFSNMPRQINI